jgi:hypothetical protein
MHILLLLLLLSLYVKIIPKQYSRLHFFEKESVKCGILFEYDGILNIVRQGLLWN